jgi:hypothetical protein
MLVNRLGILLAYAVVMRACMNTYSPLRSDANLLQVGHTVHDSLTCLFHDFLFASLTPDALKMLEVAIVYRRDVLATENANFEFLCLGITW